MRDFHLWAVVARVGYQITSGATARTYVFVTPLESLKTFDDGWRELLMGRAIL